MRFSIGGKFVGESEKPYFIADIASNHDGDLERAYKLIELAKEAGADAAKFQNFHANTIVSDSGFKNLGQALSHQKSWKKSVYDVYDDASVPNDWNLKLKEKCDEIGIEYMTSPYSMELADMVEPLVNAYKIGSGDITWTEIIEHISKKGKPVILATGASSSEDVARAMKTIQKWNEKIILMQCNTNYTGELRNFKYINLNVLNHYRLAYPEAILGLSDHTPGHATVLGAIALGAGVIEKHFTDDNDRGGPDHKFSMNPKTWKEMVIESNHLADSMGDGIKRIEENEKDSIIVQRRSLYFLRDLKSGSNIDKADVVALRPIQKNGLAPYEIEKIVGRSLKRNVTKGQAVLWEDLG